MRYTTENRYLIGDMGDVRVRDTESSVIAFRSFDLILQEGVIGAATYQTLGGLASVTAKHNRKTALFQNYIKCIETCDWRVKTLDICEGRVNVINTSFEWVSILGVGGSVVLRQKKQHDRPDIYTLYDFLCSMCREHHDNLMSYDLVHFYSEYREYAYTIRFGKGESANRFFQRMYLDALMGA